MTSTIRNLSFIVSIDLRDHFPFMKFVLLPLIVNYLIDSHYQFIMIVGLVELISWDFLNLIYAIHFTITFDSFQYSTFIVYCFPHLIIG